MTAIKYLGAWAAAGFVLPFFNMMDGHSFGWLNFICAMLFMWAGAVLALSNGDNER